MNREALRRRTIAGAIFLTLAAGAAGCTSSEKQVELSPPETFQDPLNRSALREQALVVLTTAGTNEDPLLRANAIEALHAAPGRVTDLVAAGLVDPNPGVRSVAAMTVGELRLTEKVPQVRPLLYDASPMVRASAIYALMRTATGVDPTPLAQMLMSEDVRVRAQAAFVLGELGDPSAVPMLKESDKDTPKKAPLAQVRILRLQIAEALIKLGETEAVEAVRAALYPSRPEDLEATALAAQIIGQVGDKRAGDQLMLLTAYKDEFRMPAEVRLACAGSLAQLGFPQGAFIADEFWTSEIPALRAQSAYVYGETAQPENLTKLEALMKDDAGIVRVSAAAAVLKASDRLAGSDVGRRTFPPNVPRPSAQASDRQ